MYFNFATLSLIAAALLSSVSAVSHLENTASSNNLAVSSDALLAKRAFLSRRKVAAALESRKNRCDHKNHRTYQHGDEIRHHRPMHRHHCGTDSSAHCGDSDNDFYEHEHEHDDYDDFDGDDYEYDDEDDYFECDECDECDGDYMSWSDYEDEITK